jgi:hypothetical protein
MKRAGLALALAMMPAPAAHAQSANPFQALEDCVIREATRLEVSRESAEAVATAAVAKCGVELSAAAPERGLLRANSEERQLLKNTMRETAIVHVVELRAQRYAPKPAPARRR